MILQLHDYLSLSHANGPGARAVVWTQGCNLACPGCFNAPTHEKNAGAAANVSDLARRIVSEPEIEGVSISGGEPFQQAEALCKLLSLIKESSNLSCIVFSGYSYKELLENSSYDFKQAFNYIDVLIAGRYVETKRLAKGLIGSSNKQIHFFTQRYGPEDFHDLPEAEIVIQEDGSILVTGIDPVDFREKDYVV